MRRFTRHTRRRRIAWATVTAMVVAMVALLAVAVFSPLLALRQVTVTGVERISAEQVADAVSGQLDIPLALLDFDRIEGELSEFSLIRSYVTETVPPDTLVIHIVERQPIALVARGDSYDQVDPAGVVIAASVERGGLPVIDTGGDGTDGASFRAAVEVLLAMPADVLASIDTISANTRNDVRLSLAGVAPEVAWGSGTESALKASVLARLLDQPECASAEVIDVSAPLAPICGPE